MKIRTGFVSNSSSSSFIVVGYEAKKKATSPADFRKLCEKKISKKEIKKFALDYLDGENISVDDFEKYPPLLWKELWKAKKEERDEDYYTHSQENNDYEELEYDVPNGLKYLGSEIEYAEGMVGKIVETGTDVVTIDADKMIKIINDVKEKAPVGVKISVLGISQYD